MKTALRFGLFGAGGFGAAHLGIFEKLEREGVARLVCVADPFVERLEEVKARLESRGVRWHLKYQDLLAKEAELDAVSIATPIHLHAQMAAASLARGLFVYLEKPPVPLIQQLNDLIALDGRRKVAVGFPMICAQNVRQLKRWILQGGLGAIESIRVSACWPRWDGYYRRAAWAGKMAMDGEAVFDGPATNANAHLLHNIMYFAGNTFDGFDVPSEIEGEFYRARPIESYDVASMRGRFESGIAFFFNVAHAVEEHGPYRIEVRGKKGRAWLADDGKVLESDCGLTREAGADAPSEDLLLSSYLAFLEYVRGRRTGAPTSLVDARGYLLASNGALISSGGIHTIDQRYWRIYEKEGDRGYDVPGMVALIQRATEEGRLFSELGAPWARKVRPVSVRGLRSLSLKDYLSH